MIKEKNSKQVLEKDHDKRFLEYLKKKEEDKKLEDQVKLQKKFLRQQQFKEEIDK